MDMPDARPRHTLTDDIQGIGIGVFLCGVGVHLLTHMGLVTGQTAGIAVLISYATGFAFGPVFFVVNLPFYLLAWRRLGPLFTVKSLVSVSLLSAVTTLLPLGWQPGALNPALGAVVFGSVTGIGLLALFRHNGSLGGLGVVALLIQDTTGFRAGYVQLIADAVIFAAALLFLPAQVIGWSLLGAIVLNLVIAFNHRRDRYVAT